jgi:putative intracellular protease/amidase
MDEPDVDPPLGRPVTSAQMAEKVRKLDSSDVLDNPVSLESLMPERPYFSSSNFLREFEAYNAKADEMNAKLTTEYAALLLVGGSGPIVDMVNNQRLHDIIMGFFRAGKPIAAECYGVACLAFARDFHQRKSIIWGKASRALPGV